MHCFHKFVYRDTSARNRYALELSQTIIVEGFDESNPYICNTSFKRINKGGYPL